MKLWHIKRESLENVHTRALLSIRWGEFGWEVMVMVPVPFSRKVRPMLCSRHPKMTALDAFAGVVWFRGVVHGRLRRFAGLGVIDAETKRDCYTL